MSDLAVVASRQICPNPAHQINQFRTFGRCESVGCFFGLPFSVRLNSVHETSRARRQIQPSGSPIQAIRAPRDEPHFYKAVDHSRQRDGFDLKIVREWPLAAAFATLKMLHKAPLERGNACLSHPCVESAPIEPGRVADQKSDRVCHDCMLLLSREAEHCRRPSPRHDCKHI